MLYFPLHRGPTLDTPSSLTADKVSQVLSSSPAMSSTMDMIYTSLMIRCKQRGHSMSLKTAPSDRYIRLPVGLLFYHFRVIWHWRMSWPWQITQGHWKLHRSIDRIWVPWRSIVTSPTSSLFDASVSGFPSEYCRDVWYGKTIISTRCRKSLKIC